jgi:hypothetical protein
MMDGPQKQRSPNPPKKIGARLVENENQPPSREGFLKRHARAEALRRADRLWQVSWLMSVQQSYFLPVLDGVRTVVLPTFSFTVAGQLPN